MPSAPPNRQWSESEGREELVLRAQRINTLGSLAAGLAHDLNNALAPVLLTASMLKNKLPAEDQWLASAVATSTKRGMELLKELTKLIGGSDPWSRFPPHRLLDSVARMVRGTFPPTIQVETNACNDLPRLEGDPTLLAQLLLELCLEARAHLEHGGVLGMRAETASFEQAEDSVQFVVSWQEAAPDADLVGLPVQALGDLDAIDHEERLRCQNIILERHGGQLERPEPAEGTGEIRMLLPLAGPQTEPPPNSASEAQDSVPALGEGPAGDDHNGGELEKEQLQDTILIIDDDDSVREVTRAVLANAGYNVLEASDGEEGLDIFGRHADDIALVLTDLAMGRKDGVRTIAELRAIAPQLPLIAATGLPGQASELAVDPDTLHGFLRKPFAARELLALVARVLQQAGVDRPPSQESS